MKLNLSLAFCSKVDSSAQRLGLGKHIARALEMIAFKKAQMYKVILEPRISFIPENLSSYHYKPWYKNV